jgi:hypothetical protein
VNRDSGEKKRERERESDSSDGQSLKTVKRKERLRFLLSNPDK